MSTKPSVPAKKDRVPAPAPASAEGRRQAALLTEATLRDAIFKSENVSIIATDATGVIQLFNAGAQRMLGYTASEVLNQITPADLSDPDEAVARAQALSAETGTPIRPGFEALVFKASRALEDISEFTYVRKDQTRFPALVSVTGLRDDQGAVLGYLLIGTDNSPRKAVEIAREQLDQQLRDQQFYTRSLIEANTDAIMTTDLRGVITDVNKQMEALTNCAREDLIGAPFKRFFTDPLRAEAAIEAVIAHGRITDYELTALGWEGRQTVVSYNATTFHNREGKLQGVFAAARDVTERKRLDQVLEERTEELLSAKIEADRANVSKSEFLSSMSHELRSPLNAILGFAQLMDSDVPAPNPLQKENIGQILKAGWHLLKLIDEILDLAKIEAGRVSLSPEAVSVAEVLDECQAMIEGQAQKRSVEMTFPRFAAPCFVLADRTRLKQVLLNLLSNAVKYNRLEGKVVVSYASPAVGRLRIMVTDSGAGISPEGIGQLFQPFNRLGQEAGAQEGTGIGLVVAKQLTELMGGMLGVESVEGIGSTFWLEMKVAAEPSYAVGSDQAGPSTFFQVPDPAQMRVILYVEDNLPNLRLVEQLVARRPELRLISAMSGGAGVMLARSAKPDLILMDINLPDLSGLDAMRILRNDPATANIPVVGISANAMTHDIKKALRAGFFRYLTKPIRVDEFMETISLALASLKGPAVGTGRYTRDPQSDAAHVERSPQPASPGAEAPSRGRPELRGGSAE